MSKSKTLFQNYVFNLIKTLNSILFPIITFTYSARILGVDGVGKINFVKSIISYFTMIAMLGMNYYGTREIAKRRDDREGLSKFCMEMLIINGCTTLLAYALLVMAIISIPLLREYSILLAICSVAIALQGMGMEWLYQGLEEYRYIAIRSVLFQIIALITMFIFVRDDSDVIPYTVITVMASSGSYILNFINARKYIQLNRNIHYEIRRHMKPLLWLFAMAVSIELYTVLDTSMVGFFKGDIAVGLYTAAIKIERMVNTLIASVGVVLIPRLSFYIGKGKYQETDELINKAYNYVFMLSIPAAVGLYVLSDDIILLFSGHQFASASITMRLLTPIVIFIPFSMLTNQQIFVPMGKEKIILLSTSVGAGVNFTMNMLLIPHWAENGAAVATVIAELAVAFVCFINGNIQFHVKRFFKCYYQYWLAAMVIPIVSFLFQKDSLSHVLRIVIVIILSGVGYSVLLLFMKNGYLIDAWKKVIGKISKGGEIR